MKGNISIRLKAAFLIIVFALNTMVGFACAAGIDMGFNKHHHEEEATKVTVHVHADGKKHQHHHEANKHHHDSKEDAEKGGCCNDKVIKFQNLDKNVGNSIKVPVNLPIFVALVTRFSVSGDFKYTQVSAQKYLLQYFHPPPADIRILIRSFQI
ncbi:MAG: hypothetical protein ABI741_08060 [Ferruginibacter sp.]